MSKQFKKKKEAASHATLYFFYVSADVKGKTHSSSYFSSQATVVYSPSVCLYETNCPYEAGHSIAH